MSQTNGTPACCNKAKQEGKVEGLKRALSILKSREATAKALIYDEVYLAAFEDLKIFLNAEIFREEHPERASHTYLD